MFSQVSGATQTLDQWTPSSLEVIFCVDNEQEQSWPKKQNQYSLWFLNAFSFET